MQVNEHDCLLLEFVFGNRPDDAQKVRAYVLETIASDPGLQQTELVLLGLFGRSCRILESKDQQVVNDNVDAGVFVDVFLQLHVTITGSGFATLCITAHVKAEAQRFELAKHMLCC